MNILYRNENCIIDYIEKDDCIQTRRFVKRIFGDSFYPPETISLLDKKSLPKLKKDFKNKYGLFKNDEITKKLDCLYS